MSIFNRTTREKEAIKYANLKKKGDKYYKQGKETNNAKKIEKGKYFYNQAEFLLKTQPTTNKNTNIIKTTINKQNQSQILSNNKTQINANNKTNK